MWWFPPAYRRLSQADNSPTESPKSRASPCCLQVCSSGSSAGGCWRLGEHRQQWLSVSLVLHSSFPMKGMRFLLPLQSTWQNLFLVKWGPSLGNKLPASASLLLGRKGVWAGEELDTVLLQKWHLLAVAGKKMFWIFYYSESLMPQPSNQVLLDSGHSLALANLEVFRTWYSSTSLELAPGWVALVQTLRMQ